MHPKSIVILSDGTWQDLNQPYPTNVVKLLQAIVPKAKDGREQIVFYDEGVGTSQIKSKLGIIDRFNKWVGGGLGVGIDHRIQMCYKFICLNYNPGDTLYLFGFSRGAYTVRSLAGLIYNCGLLRRECIRKLPDAYELYRRPNEDTLAAPEGADAVRFRQMYCRSDLPCGRPEIDVLGVWDTVKALGIPNIPILDRISPLNNARYAFHDDVLSEIIKSAFHAVAIDERRSTFELIPVDVKRSTKQRFIAQSWFPGGHGAVGGGDQEQSGLSDCALEWMLSRLDKANSGLEYDTSLIQNFDLNQDYNPDPLVRTTGTQFSVINTLTYVFGSRDRVIPPETSTDPFSTTAETISQYAIERWTELGEEWRPKPLLNLFQSAGKMVGQPYDAELS